MKKVTIKAKAPEDIKKLDNRKKEKEKKDKYKGKKFGNLSDSAQEDIIIAALIRLGILDEKEKVI